MVNAFVPLPQSAPHRLVDQVKGLKLTLAHEGVQLTDMSRAGALEAGIGTIAEPDGAPANASPVGIVRLEGPIEPREVAVAAPGVSRFRYFLDGSQKSIPVCRIGLTPVVAALSAAGILERDPSGHPSLRGAAFRVNQSWIAPTATGNPALDRLIDELSASGGDIRDPFVDRYGNPVENYQQLAGDYSRALRSAFDMAGTIRAEQEATLIDQWDRTLTWEQPNAWIVIDGPLRGNVRNAIGLVKSLQTQHLASAEAIALFDLRQGQRTTAFRYAANPGDADPTSAEGKTMWFMRLWSSQGMDARHSLVRIETAHDVCTTEQIDEISGWILAERLPRATDDPRWPTLLYPISYLERILKRKLAELTAGWPSE
jgi:hypothetical protein